MSLRYFTNYTIVQTLAYTNLHLADQLKLQCHEVFTEPVNFTIAVVNLDFAYLWV